MPSDDQIYLGLFIALIVGSFFLAQRTNVAQILRGFGRWVLIGFAIALVGATWGDLRVIFDGQASVSQDGQEITVPRSFDGHYYLTLEVNGHPVRFMVDTGATDIVLSREDAEKSGLDMDRLIFLGQAQTANGIVQTAPVRLDSVGIGPVMDRNVRAVVNGGELHGSLLGMGYLSRFGTFLIEDSVLTLRR